MYSMTEKNTGGIISLVIAMLVLFGGNMTFNYFVLSEKIAQKEISQEKLANDIADKIAEKELALEIEKYGSKENYEKAMILQKAQNRLQVESQFGKDSVADVQKKIDEQVQEALKQMAPAVNADSTVSKSDIIINTPIYGKENTPFSILEFSDLECPACQGFHNSWVLEQFVKDHPDEVNYIYKNFQFHSGAPMKWEAALCVAEAKGGDVFYEYIDKHFKGQNLRASRDEMIALAGELWVDENTMKECLDSGKFKNALTKEFEQAKNMFGVSGTPTIIIINNKTGKWGKLNSRSPEDFQNLIDSLK